MAGPGTALFICPQITQICADSFFLVRASLVQIRATVHVAFQSALTCGSIQFQARLARHGRGRFCPQINADWRRFPFSRRRFAPAVHQRLHPALKGPHAIAQGNTLGSAPIFWRALKGRHRKRRRSPGQLISSEGLEFRPFGARFSARNSTPFRVSVLLCSGKSRYAHKRRKFRPGKREKSASKETSRHPLAMAKAAR